MKKEIKVQKEKSIRIDIHDDKVMQENGLLRYPLLKPRDENVWTKTAREKKSLKHYRSLSFRNSRILHSRPKKSILRDKLIVYLKSNKKFPKSTYSYICWNSEIDDILRKFRVDDLLIKYSFNGTTYAPNEQPWINL